MQLQIVTPERQVLSEDVDGVYAVTTEGEIGILPKHIPLISPLDIGVLRYTKGGRKGTVAVMGGLIRTDGKTVTVLCDAAERGDEIDRARAEQAKARAEAKLHERSDNFDQAQAELALSRALTRLKAAQS